MCPSDFANFGKEIYSVAETLSSCSFIACEIFNVSTVPKIRHFKHKSPSFSTRNDDVILRQRHTNYIVILLRKLRVLHSMWIYFTVTKFNESLGGSINNPPSPSAPQTEPGTCLLTWKVLARLIVRASFMRKAFVLFVCIRMLVNVNVNLTSSTGSALAITRARGSS